MSEKIRTLILSGANNHGWQMSTPYCWFILAKCGRFDTDVTTTPSQALEDPEVIGKTDVFFMDYNGPMWSETAKENFEKAIAGGKGLVVLHAADNAFTGWVEFEKMVGLMWREGTSHGGFHEFPVTVVDKEHPVTRGVPDFKQWDELYHNLVHLHDVDCHVLATAFSSKESGGTGKDEPVMVTTRYGEGRIFHMVLGHVWSEPDMRAFDGAEFQKTLQRGTEWAATGEVTLD